MSELKETAKTYGIVLGVGAVLTKIAMAYTASVRGSSLDIGGELLIIPGLVMMVYMYREMKADGMFDIFGSRYDDEDEDEEYEDDEEDD